MYEDKIVDLQELSKICAALQKEGEKIVQCHGCFDLLHPGHIRHFESAKKYGDILVVTITPDKFVLKGPGRPVFNERLRMESIAALSCVDYVSLNKWETAIDTIKLLKPDFYVKGGDYSDLDSDLTGNIRLEEEAVEAVGGKIKFTNEITFSSTELINAHYSLLPDNVKDYLSDFGKKYTAKEIIRMMQKFKNLKVLIIGDAIIDEYCYCTALGKVEKAPIIATKFEQTLQFAGGSLAIANHIAEFCENLELISLLGEKNSMREFIDRNLNKNIKRTLFFKSGAQTTSIKRFIERFQDRKMFEIAFFDDSLIKESLENEILNHLNGDIRNYDLVLIADFGHGFITKNIANYITDNARFVSVNTQTNSRNYGFNYITKYKNVDYISVDEHELRLPLSDRYSKIEDLIIEIHEKVGCPKINITLGDKGSIFYQNGKFHFAPIFSTNVLDTVGAGDAVLSITTMCAYANFPPEIIPFVGNCVGALAVQILGNKEPIKPIHLYKFMTGILK